MRQHTGKTLKKQPKMTTELIERREYDVPGGTMSAVHFGYTRNPVKLVFLHANGFNAYAYRTVLAPLGIHVIALDLRGHGMTALQTHVDSLKNWHIFRDDVEAFFDRYIDHPVVLGGHSYGAVTGILLAPILKDRLSGYVGFDPVMVPSLFRFGSRFKAFRTITKKHLPIARGAGRRKFIFTDYDEAYQRYKDRGAFKGFDDQALRDYLTGGLKPHADGVQLACHPLWEQAIFAAQAHNMFKAAKFLPKHTHIISAGRGAVSTKRLRQKIQNQIRDGYGARPNGSQAGHVGGGYVDFKPELTHLFPFQNTEFASQVLRAACFQQALNP